MDVIARRHGDALDGVLPLHRPRETFRGDRLFKFDPARPEPKGNLTYLSWGVGACLCLHFPLKAIVDGALLHGLGRTTCLGMRLARLNTKLIVALLLMDFDFDTASIKVKVVGGKFVDLDSAPKPNWNDPLDVRPVEGRFFVRYTGLDDPKSRVAGCQEW